MSENIIINSDKFSTDSFFISLFSWNGMSTKDCGWLKVVKDTSHASFKFSWMKDAKRRLSSKDPSDWDGLQRRLMTWQPRNAVFVGCSLPFENHPISRAILARDEPKEIFTDKSFLTRGRLPYNEWRGKNIYTYDISSTKSHVPHFLLFGIINDWTKAWNVNESLFDSFQWIGETD